MEFEKAVEFILNEQAKTEALRRENEERWKKNDERWKKAERRFQLIARLMATGMKALREQNDRVNMLIDVEERNAASIQALSEAQKKTEAPLQRFLERRNGSNGNEK